MMLPYAPLYAHTVSLIASAKVDVNSTADLASIFFWIHALHCHSLFHRFVSFVVRQIGLPFRLLGSCYNPVVYCEGPVHCAAYIEIQVWNRVFLIHF